MSTETVAQSGFDPNIATLGGIEISMSHLDRLMTGVHQLDRAYPFLSYDVSRAIGPYSLDNSGRLIDNPGRMHLRQAIVGAAPAAGKLLMGLSGESTPEITPEEATQARQGLQPYLPRRGAGAELARDISDEELTYTLNLAAQSTPLPTGLGYINRFVHRKAGAYIDEAAPYIEALSAGPQAEVGQEFQYEVQAFLGLALGAARQSAAARERASGPTDTKLEKALRENPDKYLSRNDAAIGIQEAISLTLADNSPAPMLRGLTQAILMRLGKTELKLDTRALEVATDIIIPSLLAAVPEEDRQQFAGLHTAATRVSSTSLAAKSIMKASAFIPGKELALRIAGQSAKQAKAIANGRTIYNTLKDTLPGMVWALSGLLPSANKNTVTAYYNALRKNFGTPQHLGNSAISTTVQN